ncbi:MAG TPA: hypothetical protein PLQ93_04375 [Bacteroidia bacterium]|nr:hypothetical protein [Bacteroidia bacterium]
MLPSITTTRHRIAGSDGIRASTEIPAENQNNHRLESGGFFVLQKVKLTVFFEFS